MTHGKTPAWTCFDPTTGDNWSWALGAGGLDIKVGPYMVSAMADGTGQDLHSRNAPGPKTSAFTAYGVVQAHESGDVRFLVGTDHCGEFVTVGARSVEMFGPAVLVEPEAGLVPWSFLERYIPNIRQMIANKMALEALDEAEEED